MSWFKRFREFLGLTIEGRPLTDPAVSSIFGMGQRTAAGQDVSPEISLTISAVYAAVQIRAGLQASLPLGVYRKREGKKEEAYLHPAARVLAVQPNSDMTPKAFWEVIEVHRLLWGNGYAEITWDGGGNVRELWPIEPWRVTPERRDGQLRFVVDGKRRIKDADLLRFPHMTLDGVVGRSVIGWARESLGLSLAAQDYGATFFGNGGVPSGVLEHPGKLQADARKNIRDDWRKVHTPAEGGRNNDIAVLWEGMKYSKVGIPPEDAQFLETRKFQIAEVSRFFKVPLHMLGDLANAHFDNIESQQIEFVVYSLMPELIQREQEIDRKLLKPPALYSKHCVRGMLRGDMAAQSQFFREMFGIGVYSVNEIKELLDENPVGPDGDKRFVPMNMVDLSKVDELADAATEPKDVPPNQPPAEKPTDPPPDSQMAAQLISLGEGMGAEALGWLIRKEANAAIRAADNPTKFLSWMDEFYGTHAEQMASSIVRPVAACLAAAGRTDPVEVLTIARAIADQHVLASRELLLGAAECPAAELSARVSETVKAWSARAKLSLKGTAV